MAAIKRKQGLPKDGDGTALRPKEKEIYDAAARIFYEKGFAATSNQEIAAAVGMLKGSLYYYISSKEDLLYGVLKQAYAGLGDHLLRSKQNDTDPIGRLRFFIVGYTERVVQNMIGVAVLERDLRALSPERRREVIAWRDEYEHFLRDLLRAGQLTGTIRKSVDVRLAAIIIFTQIHALHTWFSPEGQRSPTEVGSLLADLVINGLAE